MQEDTRQPKVRFAPSPTGLLHIGSVRTAYFNYLFAKKYGARLVLRFEDTDTERSKKEFEENIIEGFNWLGLTFDETYKQSERSEIYSTKITSLIESGAAYVSEETEGERESVIRFRNPNTTITFTDEVRGEISFDTTELGDFVIAKSETEPLYHLAVVIDDHEMGITHVIRGEDHISNTPRQILILEALGAQRPTYAHIPMILAPDRSKMSKRHGAVSVTEYREQGFQPAAVLNYMALLGWNPGGETEVFTVEETINLFDIKKIHKAGAIFSTEKMKWFNKEHLKLLSQDTFKTLLNEYLKEKDTPQDLLSLIESSSVFLKEVLERIETFEDLLTLYTNGDYSYLFAKPEIKKEMLIWKDETEEATGARIKRLISLISELSEKKIENPESVKEAIWDFATKEGRGQVLSPMRLALSGKERSMDPFTITSILGKIETLDRLESALDVL